MDLSFCSVNFVAFVGFEKEDIFQLHLYSIYFIEDKVGENVLEPLLQSCSSYRIFGD